MNYINTLKLIALIAMVIDHMAVFFPPTIQIIMRGVGRATFVIFGFLIGLNYVNKSQNNVSAPISHNKLFKFKNIKTIFSSILLDKQIKWLFAFALLSQLPYYLYINEFFSKDGVFLGNPLNIFFSLLASALFLKTKILYSWHDNKLILISVFLFSLLLSHYSDYGILGFLYVLSTYYFIKLKNPIIAFIGIFVSFIVLNFNLISGYLIGVIHWQANNPALLNPNLPFYVYVLCLTGFAFFAIVGCLYYVFSKNQNIKYKSPIYTKLFFYSFYAVHLLIIWISKTLENFI